MRGSNSPKPRRTEPVKTQGRFAHLFRLERNEAMIAEIQGMVDAYWASVS